MKSISILNKYKFEFILNLLVILFYIFIYTNLHFQLSENIMFSTPDSLSYLNVSKWIETGNVTNSIEIRTFLFPLLLFICLKIGYFTIWFLHLIFWIISYNLIYQTVVSITNNKIYSVLPVLFFVTNLSLITMSFHALTELTATFLISLFCYIIVKYRFILKEIKIFHYLLIVLIFLSLIRPVFTYFTLFFGVLMLIKGNFKNYFQKPKLLYLLILIISPLIIQITINKITFNSISISKIGNQTITDYYLTDGIIHLKNKNRNEARKIAREMNRSKKIELLMNNKLLYLRIYKNNIIENIRSSSNFLNYPKGSISPNMYNTMIILNKIYFQLHIIFAFLIPISLIIMYKQKKTELIFLTISINSILIFILLTSGVSNRQGDRLALPSIGCWTTLYSIVLFSILKNKNLFFGKFRFL